jgi:hypothetical protein
MHNYMNVEVVHANRIVVLIICSRTGIVVIASLPQSVCVRRYNRSVIPYLREALREHASQRRHLHVRHSM